MATGVEARVATGVEARVATGVEARVDGRTCVGADNEEAPPGTRPGGALRRRPQPFLMRLVSSVTWL